ncbi:helix-turn-helix domain-containing protein [uncultured Flavobacterium sp.]|jgi:AraC-like DNA-binding protein|uniref:helix-turn-helix domain-containing protein n=1 Tax=uncultured Flavobacterium sp. TaxID=165435 RepID=UPI0011FD1473|nr:helix-turn-helix domain-containing protein [uncultured Flavobacterium sp.]THD30189.1 MAG: AraC family transcriptional regulator [Flavobacterium johnsoniae]
MNYKQYPVHPALKNWIRYFWSYDVCTSATEALHIRSFADRYPRLVFQDICSFSPIKDAQGTIKPICYLSGVDTQPTDAYWESHFSHFGVSFQPHALHFLFGINAAELTNQTPDIQLLDKTEIPVLLLNAKNHLERVSILSEYFYKRISKAKGDVVIDHLFLGNWADRLDNEKNLATIASHYQISERQLQRRFKQNVGVSARKFARVAKFEKSLPALSLTDYGSLTQLAYDLEYSDQSHFIKDFKLFSGLSPYEFVKQSSLGSESASFIYIEELA